MCGNSICQDRRFLAATMPSLERFFHYRNLDVSTLKELARRWKTAVLEGFKKAQAHTALADIPPAGSFEYLRTQAIGRLYLDNVANVQSSWVTQGPPIGQVALQFGANDFGSVMMEENVVSQAGTTFRMTVADMQRLIKDLGYEPHQRDNWYHLVN